MRLGVKRLVRGWVQVAACAAMTTNATVTVPESCRECGEPTKVSTAEAILGDDGMLAVMVSTHPHRCGDTDGLAIPCYGSAVQVRE